MNRRMRLPVSILCLGSLALPSLAADDFAKYQVIIDKLPFGKVPDKPVVVAPPAPPADLYAWVNDWRLAFITQTADNKAKVGLVNVKDQSTAVIESGETHAGSGIQLVAVNYDERTAALAKGGQNGSLKLQDASTPAPAAGAPAAPGNPRVPPTMGSVPGRGPSPFSGGRPPRPNNTPPPTPTVPSATQPRLTGAELEKHLQDYQVEVLRKGLPPLPVQLTPENDAKLVQEGVLPPVEAPATPDAGPAAPGQ